MKDKYFNLGNVNMEIYNLLLNDIIDMLAKKLPQDLAISNQKLE
jgi:hypothetical protein